MDRFDTFKTRCAAALLAAAAGLLPSASPAQDIKERNLKLTFNVAKDSHIGKGAEVFAERVRSKSGGKIKVTLYPGGMLGGHTQDLSSLRAGTIDIAIMATGLLAGIDSQFVMFDLPFLFNDSKEAFALSDGPIAARLLGGLPQHGLVGLSIWDLGFRNLTNARRPIAKAEDIEGLKLRVIGSPIYLEMFSALGANALPMSFPEVYGALESRAIDGQENPLAVIQTSKFHEVQKYLTLSRHVYSAMPVLMGKKTWDGLSEAERKLIMDAAEEAKIEERKISLQMEAQTLTLLRTAMQVTELPPAELARLRQKVQPVVQKFSKVIGEDLMKQVDAELARLRAAR
jgi:tripartite ATP-independent transporter DctP family solute receptor